MRLYATALTAVLAGTLLLAAGEIAEAYLKAGPNVMPGGHHRLVSTAGAVDGIASQPSAAYSFRKLKSTYAGSAVRLRRASDNAEQDIGFLGFVPGLGSPLDFAAANAFCAATSCFVRTWYDQSGNARDAVQATPASQPALVFNCIGTLPCLRAVAAGPFLQTSATFTPTVPASFSVVGNRGGPTIQCNFSQQVNANNALRSDAAVANTWYLFGGTSGVIVGAATDGSWHAAAGILNAASSVLRIDGVEVGGTTVASATVGPYRAFFDNSAGTCSQTESIWWDGYALTAAERIALTNNQRSFWGF